VSAALGLHDHEQHHKDGVYEHDARRLREFVARGRVLSHELGAWPWCHAAGGRLPRGWHGQESFLGRPSPPGTAASLTRWRTRATSACTSVARRSERRRSDDPRQACHRAQPGAGTTARRLRLSPTSWGRRGRRRGRSRRWRNCTRGRSGSSWGHSSKDCLLNVFAWVIGHSASVLSAVCETIGEVGGVRSAGLGYLIAQRPRQPRERHEWPSGDRSEKSAPRRRLSAKAR
jgi:hypothetical protein